MFFIVMVAQSRGAYFVSPLLGAGGLKRHLLA